VNFLSSGSASRPIGFDSEAEIAVIVPRPRSIVLGLNVLATASA